MARRSRVPISGNSIRSETKKAFRIEGLSEALDNVAKVIDSVSGRDVKELFFSTGKVIADEIKERAPVDRGVLRDAVFVGRGDMNRPDVLVGVSYGKAPHAHLIEYGTEQRYHKGGKYVGYVNAQPFVRPAIDASSQQVKRQIIDGLKQIVLKHTRP